MMPIRLLPSRVGLTVSLDGAGVAIPMLASCTADPGLRLNAYVAEPGTASADALSLLASWASTPNVAVHAEE